MPPKKLTANAAAGTGDITGFFRPKRSAAQSCDNFSQSQEVIPESRQQKRSRTPDSTPEVNVSRNSARATAEPHARHKKCKPKDKAFNCTVHGRIELHPTLWRIIDTPQFQRLRRCKQLGHASLVFPNATHTRFEHSVGVAYKAGKLVKRIQEKQPGLSVTNKDKLCVEIAALVHDLGHGPFSHQFEHVLHEYGKVLKQTPDQTFENLQKAEILLKWSHEEQSIKMLDYLLKKNKIDLAREENGALDDRDLIFIKELINGAPINGSEDQFEGRGYDKIFLYEIVSNKKTGLDVDRLDYLQRDTEAALGLHCKVFEKLCESVAVCREDSGRLVLAYPEEQVQGVMQLYTTRIKMYTEVYMHRKVLVMDEMVKDILLLAKDFIEIPVRDPDLGGRITERRSLMDVICHDDLQAFSNLDDSVLALIRNCPANSDQMAQASMLMHRLDTRDLYITAGNLCIQDKGSLACMEKDHNPKFTMDNFRDESVWRCCSSAVHKQRALWALCDSDPDELKKDIVEFVRSAATTPPVDEVPDSDGEQSEQDEQIHSSQLALMEAEENRRPRRDGAELLPSDLRLKKYTVSTGGGGCKFSDPVQHVWFYCNDASEYDSFEYGNTRPHRVDPEHYKMSMPASFCTRELKVLCTDRNKIKMAEVAVNKFCEFMRMPKAINQSSLSQVMDSPIGCSSAQSIPNGCDPIPDDEKECAYFSQLP